MNIRILTGDCRTILPTLDAGSVQCVVTSPPYFGLRDYGTATWDGGDPACDHVSHNARNDVTPERLAERALKYGTGTGSGSKVTAVQFRDLCGKCGATRVDAQIGLEASPAEYIAEMVAVFREVRRVLRDDGTVWLNLGDSYASHDPAGYRAGEFLNPGGRPPVKQGSARNRSGNYRPGGAKPKDLMMMPARVAIALQADGWFLRSDIIWHKPNPMPESVTDRPTSSHEHVFLLTKQPRYFYDAEAVREPMAEASAARYEYAFGGAKNEALVTANKTGIGVRTRVVGDREASAGRNLRNVWTIATAPYPDAHFATFPPELAERCIKAGSKPGDTILDPFSGAGTTALVADRLNRNAIGIELNETYAAMGRARVTDDAPLFAEVS